MFENSMLFLDLETTGLSPENNEIIEIGAWLFKSGVLSNKYSMRIKPVRYLPSDVQALTGITNEALADCDGIEAVLPEFIDFCKDYPLYGYNLDFDYRFLCVKARVLGFDFTLNGSRKGVDVLKAVRSDFNFKSYKLENVAKEFNLPVEAGKLHTASYDAYITKLVYDRCMQRRPEYLDKTRYGTPIITDTLDYT